MNTYGCGLQAPERGLGGCGSAVPGGRHELHLVALRARARVGRAGRAARAARAGRAGRAARAARASRAARRRAAAVAAGRACSLLCAELPF